MFVYIYNNKNIDSHIVYYYYKAYNLIVIKLTFRIAYEMLFVS